MNYYININYKKLYKSKAIATISKLDNESKVFNEIVLLDLKKSIRII